MKTIGTAKLNKEVAKLSWDYGRQTMTKKWVTICSCRVVPLRKFSHDYDSVVRTGKEGKHNKV